MKSQIEGVDGGSLPATNRQRNLAQRLGLTLNSSITVREAAKLIDDYKKQQREERGRQHRNTDIKPWLTYGLQVGSSIRLLGSDEWATVKCITEGWYITVRGRQGRVWPHSITALEVEGDTLVKCPGCSLILPESLGHEQVAHMEARHPEIIEERLRQAGELPNNRPVRAMPRGFHVR